MSRTVAERGARRPNRLWYAFIAGCARRLFFGVTGGVRAEGLANVPRLGGVIVAPTHFSTLDPPAVASVCPRQLRFMAKEELFRGWFGRFIASVGAFPLRRGAADSQAVRQALAALADGQCLLLFPEGRRGDGVRLGAINPGLAMLAGRSGAAVVPVAIAGTLAMLPRGAKRPRRGRVVVRFGRPFTYRDVAEGRPAAAGREAFARALQARLLELSREAGSPLEPPVPRPPGEQPPT